MKVIKRSVKRIFNKFGFKVVIFIAMTTFIIQTNELRQKQLVMKEEKEEALGENNDF